MKKLQLRLFAAAIFLTCGCNGDSTENLSTKGSDDPARLQKANEEASQTTAKAKSEESKKFQGAIKVEP